MKTRKLDALRTKWEGLQANWRRITAQIEEADRTLALKYGPGHRAWMGRGERSNLEKLSKQRDRFWVQIFKMTEEISPRNWGSGAPVHWIASSLTFDDMIRPLAEPLSVVPPLSYGSTHPIT